MIKGMDRLISELEKENCPFYYGLNNVNYEETVLFEAGDEQLKGCKYGDGEHEEKCKECFEKAIALDYTE